MFWNSFITFTFLTTSVHILTILRNVLLQIMTEKEGIHEYQFT